MRILIVEDDQRIAKPLAEDLKHQNYVVDITFDGIEAWEYAQATEYDLILLDLMLPKLDGISLCSGSIVIIPNRHFKYISIQIQDTGIGIAPDNIERVFERLWRADTSRHYHGGGSGLGLAIAKAIAQNHNGWITLSSQLGVGSCFTVYLPLS